MQTRPYAVLQFWGDECDPRVVSKRLRLPPSETTFPGQPRVYWSGNKLEDRGDYSVGCWRLSTQTLCGGKTAKVHLRWLLDLIGEKRSAILELCHICDAEITLMFTPHDGYPPRSLQEEVAYFGINLNIPRWPLHE